MRHQRISFSKVASFPAGKPCYTEPTITQKGLSMDAQLNPEGMHRSGIYVNDGYSLAKAFSRLIDGFNDPELCLYAVVGYFRSSGYFPLKESLKKLKKVRVVVGINADALSVRWHRESREAKERMVREQAYRELCERIEQEGYNGETENGLKSFVDDVLAGRLELRAYAARVVHAKLYVFIPENWDIYAARARLLPARLILPDQGLVPTPHITRETTN
jgi:hypothetical protein